MFFIFVDKPHCVYIHTNKINGKKYIGLTSQVPEHRWGENGSRYVECPHFWNAIQKYGWDNFTHEIYENNLTRDQAIDLEIELIKKFDTTNPEFGYNISKGGDSPDAELSVERWKDEEYKKRCSDSMREAWKDPEKRKRRSAYAKSRWNNNEERKKLEKAIKEKCSRKVICVENNKVYDCITDVETELNVNHSNIIRSIKQGYRCGGYHWKYYDDVAS